MIQSNTLDLVGRQTSERSSARDKRDVDDSGSFRDLLKGKDQRADSDQKVQDKPEKPDPMDKKEPADGKTDKKAPIDEKTDDKNQQSALENAVSQTIQDMMTPDMADKADGKQKELIPITLFGELSAQELKSQKIQNLTLGEEQNVEEIGELPQTKLGEGEQVQTLADLLNAGKGQETKTEISEIQVQQADILPQDKNQKVTENKASALLQDDVKAAGTQEPAVITVKAQGKESENSSKEQLAGSEEKTADKTRAAGVQEEKPEENSTIQETLHQPDTHEVKGNTAREAEQPVLVKAEQPEQLPEKLSDQILRQVSSGKNELDVQLEPENLGKIHIKISYDNNQMNVAIICSESKTFKLLSQSAGDLGNILESNTERPVQVMVDKQEPDYLNKQEQQQQGQGRQESGQEKKESSEDFIQKLRLGLVDTDQLEQGGRVVWQG